MPFKDEQLLIFDGGCGTTLQSMELPKSTWAGMDGCNEYLNICSPETIIKLHTLFLEAGAMVVETNTFGASSIVLAEYGLEDKVEEINTAAVNNARQAIAGLGDTDNKRYIAGSVGPTTKLPVLGHIDPVALGNAIREQVNVLLDCGVDALIVETCQDLLQVKTSLIACFDLLKKKNIDVPVLCSVTFEQAGTMLVGTDISAVCATVSPFPVFSLGLNCATGPTDMYSHIHYLCQNWPKRISCIPNQGMPEVVDGKTSYPMSPEEFSQHMLRFVSEENVSIVGGCCGTSPAHILELSRTLSGVKVGRK